MLLSNDIDNFNNLSVLSPGYIISPEGNIVTVLDDEDHSDVGTQEELLSLLTNNVKKNA